jgi:hypothetical protein
MTATMSLDVIAYHEAGHAAAGIILGIGLIYIRIVKGEDGLVGVKPKTNPFPEKRPPYNPPGEFTGDEWAELSNSDEKWKEWQRKDNERYTLYYLAGKAAQIKYAGTAKDDEAKADYSFVQHRMPLCYARLGELEMVAREFVEAHWAAIEAIAKELLKRSELTPAEVEEIIRRVMPEVKLRKPLS